MPAYVLCYCSNTPLQYCQYCSDVDSYMQIDSTQAWTIQSSGRRWGRRSDYDELRLLAFFHNSNIGQRPHLVRPLLARKLGIELNKIRGCL